MTDTEYEQTLGELLESIRKEINNDMLERIVFKIREKSKCNKLGIYDDVEINEFPTKSSYCTKNVATMTDPKTGATTSCSGNSPGRKESSSAGKQDSKKRSAEERREMQLSNKMYKPGECMKHMRVEIHATLADHWLAADVARELEAAGARLRATTAPCSPALVLWTRALPGALEADAGLLRLAAAEEKSDRALYVATAEEVSTLVASKTLSQELGSMGQLSGCALTLVLFGVGEYFKSSGRKKNSIKLMTEVELEMALTDLLVTAGCDTVKVDTPNELALTIVNFTKAIAETPHKLAKRQCDESAQFYMRGDSKNCVPVNKNGVGAAKLWQQMLAVLPMSSLERARALVARYPSPRHLHQELASTGGVGRVADLGVARAAAPGCLARRTGDEFARKLAILFTADDGDALMQ